MSNIQKERINYRKLSESFTEKEKNNIVDRKLSESYSDKEYKTNQKISEETSPSTKKETQTSDEPFDPNLNKIINKNGYTLKTCGTIALVFLILLFF